MTDPIDDLLIACMQRPDAEWADAIECLCADHAALAVEIRRRFAVLRGMGLVDAPTETTEFPARLGEFELRERLGSGGMGVVYRAHQTSMNRTVALKLVRPEQLYFSGAKERFRREIDAIARFSHNSIVAIFAVGEEQGIPFFAMEHIDGISLEDALRELAGQAPATLTGRDLHAVVARRQRSQHVAPDELFDGTWENVCLRIAARVARALTHAHAHDVVHRDVKPSNIMLTADGRVVLLDFGLAFARGADRLTRTGSQLGSLPYMAPEQLRAEHAQIDARTDVYALGVTLFEMLTLRSPFLSPSAETTRKNILFGNAPALRVLNRGVSRAAAIVCGKALHSEVHRRYQTAADLARDLDNALAGRDIAAQPDGFVRRSVRWARRHPAWAVGTALGLLILIGGPLTVLLAVAAQRDRAITAEHLAVANAYAANLAAASAALETNDPFEARHRLDLCDARLRGFEWRHLDCALDGSLAVLRGHATSVTAVALAFDGSVVASGSTDGDVRLWQWRTGQEIARFASGSEVAALRFSTDAQRLFVQGSNGSLRVRDLTTQQWVAARAPSPGYEELRLARHAEHVFVNHGGWRFVELDPNTLQATRTFALEATDRAPDWRFVGDAEHLAASYGDHVGIWDRQSGKLLRRTPSANVSPRTMAIGGGLTACGHENGGVTVHELATARLVQRIETDAPVERVAFNDDGSLVAIGTLDQVIRVHDSRSGRALTVLRGHLAPLRALAFGGDEELVVSAGDDRCVRVWSALFTRDQRLLGRHLGHVSAVVVSRDCEQVCTASHDGTAVIWNVRHGLFERRVGHPHHVNGVALTDDGHTLLTLFHNWVNLSDTRDGKSLARLATNHVWVTALAVRDGTLATCGSDGTVELWDLPTQARRHVLRPATRGATPAAAATALSRAGELPEQALLCVDLTSDGREVFSGGRDGRILAWRIANGTPEQIPARWVVTRSAPVTALRLTHADTTLVSAEGSMLRARDSATGAVRWERATRMPIRCLAVLDDGARLCTGSDDGAITFWDGATGKPVLTRRVHDAAVAGLAFDRERRFLATASLDGTCKLLFAEAAASDLSANPADGPPLTLAQAARRITWDGRHGARTNEQIMAVVAMRTAMGSTLRAVVAQIVRDRVVPWYFVWLDHLAALEDPNVTPERRSLALLELEALVEQYPHSVSHLMTLALAELRDGQHAEALGHAEAGLQANAEPDAWCVPVLLAIQAQALQQLGRRDDAQQALLALNEACRREPHASDPRALAHWRETEAVVGK